MRRTHLLIVFFFLSMVYSFAQTMPKLSNSSVSSYYNIRFKNGGAVIQDMGSGNSLVTATLSSTNLAQQWKVEEVTVGSGTYYITSRLSGKMNYSSNFISSTTGIPLYLRATTNATYKPAWEISRTASGACMNQWGGPGTGKNLGEYNFGDGGNPVEFIFVEDVTNDALNQAVTDALYQLNSLTVAGTNPGQYGAAARAEYQAAIDAALAVSKDGTATTAQRDAAAATLAAAKPVYLAKYNTIRLSTNGSDVWYYIVNAGSNSYCNGMVMTSVSSKAGDATLFTAKTVDPNKLWKFVDAGSGKVAIQNRVSGLYLAAPGNSSTTVAYTAAFLGADGQFTFTAAGQNPLHAQQAGSMIVTWPGGLNTPSSWKLSEMPSSDNMTVGTSQATTSTGGTDPTTTGSKNQKVLRIKLTTNGLSEPLGMLMNLNLTGSTSVNDIANVKVYFTEGRAAFDTTRLVGTSNAVANYMKVPVSSYFLKGDNYFWISYDIKGTANVSNLVQATCDTVNIASTVIKATASGVIDKRTIVGTTFTKFPKNLQLYARDLKTNKAVIPVIGQVYDVNHNTQAVKIQVYRDKVLTDSVISDIVTSSTPVNFDLSYAIPAELHNYKFVMSHKINGKYIQFAQADSVVAGDVYIFEGQSNTETADFTIGQSLTDTTLNAVRFQRPFTRTWGCANTNGAAYARKWFLGINGNQGVDGHIGTWALYIASQIQDRCNVPVAIFNGAIGGTPIGYHYKNKANPTDLNTCYGRLLNRLTETNLASAVRGFFWYQGETDAQGSMPMATYLNNFKSLYSDWKNDCPNIKNLYMVQIKIGCGTTQQGANNVQEAIRGLKKYIPELRVFSPQHISHKNDDCHYLPIGYVTLGRMIAPRVLKDLYTCPVDTVDYHSPDVVSVKYLGGNKLEITTDATNSLKWTSGAEADFKVYQTGGTAIAATSGTVSGNKIILTLNGTLSAKDSLSYWGHSGAALPTITNQKGYSILYFGRVPVQKNDQTITFNALDPVSVDNADVPLTATSTSGLAVEYASSDTTVASIVSGKIHIKKAGNVNITVSQKGDKYYNAAINVSRQLVISPLAGLWETEFSNNGIIYPNPVEDKLYIKTSNDVKFVEIVNMFCQKCELKQLVDRTGSLCYNVSALKPGMYLVVLHKDHGRSASVKFMKE